MNKNKLEHLLKQHHQNAFLWASQCCNYHQEEAKEVLQMTYLKIAEGKAVYREKSSFKTWLFAVIRFTALDHMKKCTSFDSLEELHTIVEEEQETDGVDYKKLLCQLSDRQHQVLLLSFYHGLTLSEIAEVTELHIGSVRTHYERGKEALKTLILKKQHE